MYRVLLVEDDTVNIEVVEMHLEPEGFLLDVAVDALQAKELLSQKDYDIILLDLMLPGKSGYDLLDEIRGAGITTPIIIISAKNDIDSKLKGFAHQADDYVTKPFVGSELIQRIYVQIRHIYDSRSDIIEITEHLNLNISGLQFTYKNKPIKFTQSEFIIFNELVKRNGQMMTKDHIINVLHSYDMEPNVETIDVYISSIRRKLKKATGQKFIETVHRQGVKLNKSI